MGENETLCYTVIDGQASLYVSEPISESNIDEFGVEISDFQYDTLDENMLEPMATADRFNKGGIGIRGYASKSGNYISATINNPYVVNYNTNYTVFYYLGLQDLDKDTPNADLGVQYSSVNGGTWMPYYLLRQNDKVYMIFGGTDKVASDPHEMKPNENGSVVFSNKKPLTMTVYKNVQAIVKGVSGKVVRLSFWGSDGNNSGKACQYIAEGGTGITKSVQYRVLATINRADETRVPDNTWIGMDCNYTNINVDGDPVKWSQTPEAYMSTLTDTSPGHLIGAVNMK